ncbi:MAG: S8 family serine peptidase, partial [Actinobacteria bacterium]|nr:S8 family serine peptidase [Actinomycetota bacterium]
MAVEARRRWAALAAGLLAMAATPAVGASPPPDDPLFPEQWNLPLIQVPEAWRVSTGVGATVAVLDTGVAFEDYDDARFSYRKAPGFSATRFAPGYDFVDDDEHPNDNVNPAAPHEPAHGTHKAAVIAETVNEGRGAAGVAPGATIMPVRVLDWEGAGDVAAIASGIRFAADHGAQVAVMSLTGTDSGPVGEAVRYAAGKGMIMVAPSGNDGAGNVSFPASDPDVIGVGAVTADRRRAYYSNYGDELDLVAPGGDLSADHTGDGEPDGIRQQSFVGTLDGFCHCQVEGTSAAAPHVAAVAALLVGSGLATTAAQVRHALVSSALDLGPPGRDPEFGAGLVQASGALAAAAAVAADLSVTLAQQPEAAPAGTPVVSIVTVSNAGPAAATGVVATATLSTGAVVGEVAPSQGSCEISGSTATCPMGSLAAGATATLTIVATPGT